MILIGRRSASQSGFTIPYHISCQVSVITWWIWFGHPEAYHGLPDRHSDRMVHQVGLVHITIAYHVSILGQTSGHIAFTNHYHRTEDITHSDDAMCYVGL